jgi:hypothetical protein
MDPLTMTLLTSLPQAAIGLGQTAAGFFQRPPTRPEFEIPESEKASLKSAEMQASLGRLPGQSQIEGRLDRVTANTLNTLERIGDSPVSSINAASRAYGNQLDKETELGVQAGNMYLRNQDILRNEQDEMAQWENKKFQFDEVDPYMSKVAQISALKGAGLKNLSGGLQDMFGIMAKFGLLDKPIGDDAGASGGGNMFGGSGIDGFMSGVQQGLGSNLPSNPQSFPNKNIQNMGGIEMQNYGTPEERRLMELLFLQGGGF